MRRWGRPEWTSCFSASSPASSSSSTWSTGSAFSGSTHHKRWQWMMRTELDCDPIQSSWSVDLASYSTHFFFQKIWIHVMTNMMKNQNIPQWQWTCSSSRCCPRVRWPWWWACCVAGGPLTNEKAKLGAGARSAPFVPSKNFSSSDSREKYRKYLHHVWHTGRFFNWPPPVQYRKENRPTSQPEAFLDEESHGTAAPIG